ncbi:MAG TPA: PHB depolymerase family esterase [Blastocatellia bacterium]|nr:PHB depolymerase family esterase [Blastocatellia bacterium]
MKCSATRSKPFTAILFIALIALNPLSAAAQQIPFLNELFSRYEEFNRLYNEKRRAGANVAAIDALRKRGEEAFKRFDIRAILEIEGEALAVLQSKAWDDRQKFISSLTLETDRLVIEPNRELQVSLTRMFPADIDKVFASQPTVTFKIVAAKGEFAGRPLVMAEHLPVSETSTNASRKLLLPDGEYWLIAEVTAGNQKITELRRPLYAITDFSDSIAQLNKTIADIKSSSDAMVKAVAPLVTTPEFMLERLAQLNKTRGEVEINAISELDRVSDLLSALAKGQNPFAKERGEVERAYRAADGQLVPYRVYLPKSYDGATARPMVVMLHGALGDERYYFSGLFDPAVIKGEAERRGYILVGTNGRGRLPQYNGAGMEDAIEVIKAVTRDYRIDPSRIYVTGHSMGAAGAWLLAANRPEMFAAIAPVSGAPLAQNDLFTRLLERMKSIPVMVAHGGRDGIALPQNSRDVAAAAQKAGLKVTLIEVPDADHLSVLAATFPAILDFFDKNHKPATPQ